jgi:uracil-DNA glycosylase
MADVKIEPGWKSVLQKEFDLPYFEKLRDFLKSEIAKGKVIFPPGPQIFNAFNTTPFDKVKVVILGQDPYPTPGQAMGLSFSVPKGVNTPASLQNIYKELQTDLGIPIAKHGDLTNWANQGVFLLNAMLTVEKGQPLSHEKAGWQTFTDAVIRTLSDQREGLVFLLWGKFAQQKKVLIDEIKHHILEAAHPSPLARGAFFGCRHFSKTNELLTGMGQTPINWNLNE